MADRKHRDKDTYIVPADYGSSVNLPPWPRTPEQSKALLERTRRRILDRPRDWAERARTDQEEADG
jgi:hypothetical protein